MNHCAGGGRGDVSPSHTGRRFRHRVRWARMNLALVWAAGVLYVNPYPLPVTARKQ
jgi:hypothetical protein